MVIFLKKDDDSNSNIDKFNSNVDSSSSKILDDSSSNNNLPKEEENEEETFIILPSNEKIIAKLNYDINEMFIYNEISKSTMKYSFDSDSSLRNLQENIDTIKNYKYLSFIYDISNTTDGVEKYSAYFTILLKKMEIIFLIFTTTSSMNMLMIQFLILIVIHQMVKKIFQ